MVRARLIAFALLSLLTAFASAQPAEQPAGDRSTQDAARADALTRATQSDPELTRLYEARGFMPLWTTEDGEPSSTAKEALRVLDLAETDGLAPADYHVETLHQLARSLDEGDAAGDGVERLELTLSRMFLNYLHDLRDGRVAPRAAGFVEFESPSVRGDLALQLGEALASRQVIGLAAANRPRFVEYQALMYALAHYRTLASREPAPRPIPFKKSVHPGEVFEGLAALRARLVDVGELDAGSELPPNGRYEGAVVEGVQRFQCHHLLEPDGVLGKRTLAELSVPLAARVRQVELAMERLRWLPRESHERLVLVNIPMFRLFAYERMPAAMLPRFSSKVIVGQAKRTETPIVTAAMSDIQFRPYWNVPRSIVRKEVLPAIRRQPDYMTRQNMELVAGERDDSPVVAASAENLKRLAAGTLRIRQRPGPANSLGLIKFSFPNPHDVYMHATPARSLFGRDRRDFSHGCVRVEDTTGLAEWILEGQDGWGRASIVAAMEAATSSRVTIENPVHVALFYATAGMLPDSSDITFAEDIYGLDARLEQELARRPAAALPVANATGVDVHEVGGRIEANPAALRRERRGSELGEGNIGQADVDGLPLQVQASSGNPF